MRADIAKGMQRPARADDADLVGAIFDKFARPFAQFGGGTDEDFGHPGSLDNLMQAVARLSSCIRSAGWRSKGEIVGQGMKNIDRVT
jgi:hypothetical protein